MENVESSIKLKCLGALGGTHIWKAQGELTSYTVSGHGNLMLIINSYIWVKGRLHPGLDAIQIIDTERQKFPLTFMLSLN